MDAFEFLNCEKFAKSLCFDGYGVSVLAKAERRGSGGEVTFDVYSEDGIFLKRFYTGQVESKDCLMLMIKHVWQYMLNEIRNGIQLDGIECWFRTAC